MSAEQSSSNAAVTAEGERRREQTTISEHQAGVGQLELATNRPATLHTPAVLGADDIRMTSPSRRDSTASSSSDGSVKVNCTAFPTEVIVHGRKVQKVRVLFTPQPPALTSSTERRRTRRGAIIRNPVDDSDRLPFSQEESTSSCYTLPGHPSISSAVCVLPRVTSLPESLGSPDVGSATAAILPLPFPATSASGGSPGVGMKGGAGASFLELEEKKIRQNLLNWFDLLDRRNEELRGVNSRLVLERDALKMDNERLRELMAETNRRLDGVDAENTEFKVKLERAEKEVVRLGDQERNAWQARVKFEEDFVQLKHSSAEEVRKLKEELDARNEEIKRMQTSIENNNNNNSINNNNAINALKSTDAAERLELMHKIAALEESLSLLRMERERALEDAGKLERESAGWRERFDSKCRELDVQTTRFDSLRNSFNHLQAENERLRGQYVVVRTTGKNPGDVTTVPVVHGGGGGSQGNNVVVHNFSKMTMNPSILESTRFIDLQPEAATATSTSASGSSSKHIHTVQLPEAVRSGPGGADPGSRRPSSKDAMAAGGGSGGSSCSVQKIQPYRRKKSDESTTTDYSLPPVQPNKYGSK